MIRADMPSLADMAEDDDAKNGVLVLGEMISGAYYARRAGAVPDATMVRASGEAAGELTRMQAPLLRRLGALTRRLAELESRLPAEEPAIDNAPTAADLDAFEIALAAEGDFFGLRLVADRTSGKARTAPDRTLLAKIYVERAATAKRRGARDAPHASPAELAVVVHWAPTGNGHGLCGAALAFAEGEAGDEWTGDALAVTCEACRDALVGAEAAPPIALSPTTAGLMEASPVRAAPSWHAPGLDVSALIDAARAAVEERNWRPARPALAGDRELFRLGEAIGFPVAFAPAEPLPVVALEHAEAARRVCGSDPQSMGKMLVVALEGVVERAPKASHLEALARHLESAAQTVRAWGQE